VSPEEQLPVPRSLPDLRAEIQGLRQRGIDLTVDLLNLCSETRDQAAARGDEVTAWKVSEEAAVITTANRSTRASLDRFLEHIEQAEQS
jgi:hypothetical protein